MHLPRPQGLWLVLGVVASLRACLGNESNHKYQPGEPVRLWVNKVGPYNNPQETYNYYYLPFCKPDVNEKPAHKWGGLGEVLEGNQLIDSQLDIKYRMPVQKRTICKMSLDSRKAQIFERAVSKHYWYELFIDELPVWGFVGPPPEETPEDDSVYLWTHKLLKIGYNDNRIIQVNLTSLDPQPLKSGTSLEFTFSVEWEPSETPYARRFERYLDYSFFEHQIHWFSIFNSFMMVIFLTGLVSMILLRTLRADYARYTAGDEDDIEALERDISEESGWKLVHGDVFRPPPHLPVLCALVGTGVQLALLVLATILITIAGASFKTISAVAVAGTTVNFQPEGVQLLVLATILIAIAGTLFTERGTIATVFIICYALTSIVGGYVSGGMYARSEGKTWIPTMLVTGALFPLSCFSIAAVLNTIAIAYHSLAAVPFGTIVILLLIWMLLSFPLCLLGTVIGRNWAGLPDNPCRVKRIPSPIPAKRWYLQPAIIALMGGLLPFGSIFIEMYFVFTSFWNYKVYYVYGFMLLVFLILVVVTVCVTVVATYFLLNAENYRWHWTAFASAASASLYVYLYSIHYFFAKTKMTGFFQTAFYFGYTAMFCLGLGIMCGALGYLGSAVFVRRIYRNIKVD